MKKINQLLLVLASMLCGTIACAQSISGTSSICVEPGKDKSATLTFTSGSNICILNWEEILLDQNGQYASTVTTYWPRGSHETSPQCGLADFFTLNYNCVAPPYTTPTVYKYFRVKYSLNGNPPVYSSIYGLTIKGRYEAGSITTSTATEFLNTGSGSVQVTGNQVPVQWSVTPASGTIVPGTNSATYNITETSKIKAYKNSGDCGVDNTNEIEIKVYKVGTIQGGGTYTEGHRVQFEVVWGYGTIKRWEYSTDNGATWIQVALTSTIYRHQLLKTAKFRVVYELGQFGEGITAEVLATAVPYKIQNADPTNGGNYTRQQQVTAPGITDPNAVDALGVTQKREVSTYQDGYGRVVQQNVRKGSPSQADVVQVAAHDGFGRRTTSYLPYVSALNDGAYKANAFTEQLSFFTVGTSDKIADSNTPYAKTVFEKSPISRVTEQGGVGDQWQPGAGHSNLITYSSNVANEVWLYNGINTAAAYYAANELSKIETTDPDQKKTQKFTDKAGKTILTRVQLDEKVNGATVATPWLETYNVYNELGQLKYILPPNGVKALKDASWVFSTTIINLYAHQFIYDSKGRLIEKKVPGQGWMYYCYDRFDRLVLMKDANTGSDKWIYIKYDRKNRPVMQGIYANSSARADLQANVINPLYSVETDPYYEERGTASHGYTNQAFPTSGIQPLMVNYYDNYDFDNAGGNDYQYVSQAPNDNTPMTNVIGLPTGSKRLLMDGGNTWLFSYVFYDAYGRVIQQRSNNHLYSNAPLADQDLVTITYDFEGKVKTKKNYHNAGSSRITTVINRFEYDHMGRLLKVYQNNNAASTDQLVAKYEYNEIGQLVDKKLHGNAAETSFLQSVDIRYSIQGWLTSINNSKLNDDSGLTNDADAGATSDYFGIEFLYDKTETGLTTASDVQYNGNISAIKWKGVGIALGVNDQRSFKYVYDKANRLKSAVSQVSVGSAWTKDVGALNESTSTISDDSGYDLDGNILELQRNQRKHQLVGMVASYITDNVDDLTYVYNNSSGLPLAKVTDATAKAGGFDNGTSDTNTDYTYEVNGSGNLYSDLNKGISSIVYNHLGKVTQVNFTDTRKIVYTYDANGAKLTMKTYKANNVLDKTVDYVNGFVYENAVLGFFGSPEGRVVNRSNVLEYEYAIGDHQGNTRIIVSSVNKSRIIKATFEGDANDNSSEFGNVSNVVSFVNASNSPPKVVQMNQTYKLGVTKSIAVYPGDKIDLEVYSYHENSSGYGSGTNGASAVIQMVASAFGGVNGGPDVSGKIYSGVNSAIGAFGYGGNRGVNLPAAYLNYILFDKDFKVLDMGWRAAPDAAFTKERLFFPTMDIKQAGFLFVYLSYDNASNNFVYFDDLRINHQQSNVVQYNEYYAFGLSAPTSWTRENSKNDFLYNAASELNITTGWYETFFRTYDPTIGRFTSIDPLATKYATMSGYNYAFNNPVMFNDPTGGDGSYAGDMQSFAGNPNLPQFMYGPPPPFDDLDNMWNGGGFDALCPQCPGGGNIVALCPDCPQGDPRYLPFINDPNNWWDYDPVTGDVIYNKEKSATIAPYEVVVTGSRSSENVWVDAVEFGLIAGELTYAGKTYEMFGKGPDFFDGSRFMHQGKAYKMGFNGNQHAVTNAAAIRYSKGVAKFVKGVGTTLTVASVGVTLMEVGQDINNGNYKAAAARTTVTAVAITIAATVPVFGWGIAAGIGIADAIWGDQLYEAIEDW
jgi:RHS repeat-associated protein